MEWPWTDTDAANEKVEEECWGGWVGEQCNIRAEEAQKIGGTTGERGRVRKCDCERACDKAEEEECYTKQKGRDSCYAPAGGDGDVDGCYSAAGRQR